METLTLAELGWHSRLAAFEEGLGWEIQFNNKKNLFDSSSSSFLL